MCLLFIYRRDYVFLSIGALVCKMHFIAQYSKSKVKKSKPYFFQTRSSNTSLELTSDTASSTPVQQEQNAQSLLKWSYSFSVILLPPPKCHWKPEVPSVCVVKPLISACKPNQIRHEFFSNKPCPGQQGTRRNLLSSIWKLIAPSKWVMGLFSILNDKAAPQLRIPCFCRSNTLVICSLHWLPSGVQDSLLRLKSWNKFNPNLLLFLSVQMYPPTIPRSNKSSDFPRNNLHRGQGLSSGHGKNLWRKWKHFCLSFGLNSPFFSLLQAQIQVARKILTCMLNDKNIKKKIILPFFIEKKNNKHLHTTPQRTLLPVPPTWRAQH